MVINKKFRFSVGWRTVALEISFLRRKKKEKKKRVKTHVSADKFNYWD